MRKGLGLYRKLRLIYANYNLFRFWIRKTFIGFDEANLFIQRVDKISLQLILRKNGATIGTECDIETGLIFHNCREYSNLSIGNNCHIGKNCFFDLRNKIVIHDNVVISMQCTFITHIDLSKSNLSEFYPPEEKSIIINNNVYIGACTTTLMGTEIGEGSFVAANSLVNQEVKRNFMVAGVPIKKIKTIE